MYDTHNNLDRRNQDRFTIPGAKVLYKAADKSMAVSPLVDISKSSIRFELTKDIAERPFINLELIVTSMGRITLKGRVVWDSYIDSESKKHIAIQFSPFGTWDDYNTLESFASIIELFNMYCKIPQEGSFY